MEFGVTVLREVIPDPQRLAEGFRASLDELLEAAARELN
jgi:WS/DGAT C-terminal domain